MKTDKRFYIYILVSKSRRLYIGMTNSLFNRVMQHKSGEIEGFTTRYKINRLVYYGVFKYVNNCIAREKELKKGRAPKRSRSLPPSTQHGRIWRRIGKAG